jgi:hypothetical protein
MAMPTTRAELHTLLVAHADVVIDGLIDAMAPIGADDSQWTSETIEHLLNPIQDALRTLGIPGIGGEGRAATAFWERIEDDEEEQ